MSFTCRFHWATLYSHRRLIPSVISYVHSSLGVYSKVSITSKMIWELTDESSPKRIPEIMIDVSKVGAIH
jgi:hypothetical protein